MQVKGLLLLIVATVGAGAAVKYVVLDDAPATVEAESGELFPGLLDKVNDVTEVAIQSGDQTVTLRSEEGEWMLLERGGYPAKFDQVKAAVVGIARLEIEEPKTAKPENHATLGVGDPGAEDSEAKRVELREAGGGKLASVILGNTKYRSGSQTVFARRDGEDQVYLCEGQLDIQADPSGWIEKEIIRLDRSRLSDVEIVHADGEIVRVAKNADDAFEIENVPEGREPKNPGVANSTGTALTYLALEDVRSVDQIDFSADPIAQTTYRCNDGLVVHAQTARQDGKAWIKISAEYEEPMVPVGPAPAPDAEEPEGESTEEGAEAPAEEAPAEEEPAEEEADEEPDPEAVRSEVEELNERHSGWAYAIPDYKLDVIARHMEDLLAEPAEEEPEGDVPLSLEGLLDGEGADEPSAPEAGDADDGDASAPKTEGAETEANPAAGETPPAAGEEAAGDGETQPTPQGGESTEDGR